MSPSSLTIVNAAVFDGWSAEPVEGPVHVEDGVVVQIGGTAPASAGRVIDARGGTVVPGLIDAHFHAYGVALGLMEIETAPLSYLALSGARRLAAALGRGFTTVRDVAGGDPGLAKAIEQGLIPSPRYLYTGPALTQTGGHGDPRPGDSDLCACGGHMGEIVDGVDPLRRAVRDRFRRGAHAIKIMASGGVVSLTDPIRIPQYSPEEVRAVTGEAARRGSYVAAHAYSPEAIVHSVENGVRSVEHGNLLDEATAALMAERGAYLVPTLATYDAMDRRGADVGLAPVSRAKNAEVLDAGRRAVEIAAAAGVRVGFGTDLMGALDDEQLNGLRLQAEVMGPLGALRSATSVNADLIGRDDLGRVRPGAVADLLVLDGDPFTDPSVLWAGPERRTVIQNGTVLPPLT
ncbi:metal-dependent hydrolase family protein [Nonomuraea pusilla]|uniref:Imidazolonepropionase n=1 Tax=Nonomuraea pusilla TaxID=46177 RepID=A0A1H8FSM3_9ACTN|nr:amidohydrolase family protein [Nonomuraea pusilla]SEN34733.1 Imidazolonepropionase [Nonomuraea pusilla]